jgi:hypothetical protein
LKNLKRKVGGRQEWVSRDEGGRKKILRTQNSKAVEPRKLWEIEHRVRC